MLYFLETKLNPNLSIEFALKYIYGLGTNRSKNLSKKSGFSKNLKVKNLTEKKIKDLLKLIEISDLLIMNDLKKFRNLLVKNLVFIKSYRGLRKIKGLPVRGQRTHTNSKTARKFI